MNKQHRVDRVERLAKEHGRMIFATAHRILGRPEDAEDVLQGVFLKLLERKSDRLWKKGMEDWGAYLRVMAARRAIDVLRKNRSRNKREIVEPFETIPAPTDRNPLHETERREQVGRLREALSRIPVRDARAFVLRHFEEFSYREISDRLETSVSQVGVVLHRARKQIEEILEPWVDEIDTGDRGQNLRVVGGEEDYVDPR